MPETITIGIANTPAAVGQTTIETTVSLIGSAVQGTNNVTYIKTNPFSPQGSQTIVSNSALQNIPWPAGAVGVQVKPPDGSTSANVVFTAFSFGWANNIAPVSPIAAIDLTFDPNFLPTQLQANATPSNLPLGLLFY